MTAITDCGPYLLIGIDSEGERRQSNHASLEAALAVGREHSKSDESGPAWQRWEIWGNHPATNEWLPLMCSSSAMFRLGRIVSTPEALETVPGPEILAAIARHQSGDWGELPPEDHAANDRALIQGARLLSAYRSKSGLKFWLITEADRSATTVLLPQEY